MMDNILIAHRYPRIVEAVKASSGKAIQGPARTGKGVPLGRLSSMDDADK